MLVALLEDLTTARSDHRRNPRLRRAKRGRTGDDGGVLIRPRCSWEEKAP